MSVHLIRSLGEAAIIARDCAELYVELLETNSPGSDRIGQ